MLRYCGWKKVRHLPIGSPIWHPSTDQLVGIDVYGDPVIDTAPWSLEYKSLVHDQFAFASGDLSLYIIATVNEIIGQYYFD